MSEDTRRAFSLGYREGIKHADACVELWATEILLFDAEQVEILMARLRTFRQGQL